MTESPHTYVLYVALAICHLPIIQHHKFICKGHIDYCLSVVYHLLLSIYLYVYICICKLQVSYCLSIIQLPTHHLSIDSVSLKSPNKYYYL